MCPPSAGHAACCLQCNVIQGALAVLLSGFASGFDFTVANCCCRQTQEQVCAGQATTPAWSCYRRMMAHGVDTHCSKLGLSSTMCPAARRSPSLCHPPRGATCCRHVHRKVIAHQNLAATASKMQMNMSHKPQHSCTCVQHWLPSLSAATSSAGRLTKIMVQIGTHFFLQAILSKLRWPAMHECKHCRQLIVLWRCQPVTYLIGSL